jgi:hypothetical protein
VDIVRRSFFCKLGGYSLLSYAAGRQFVVEALAKPAGHSFCDNIYTRLGVRPFISANIPFTFLSAALEWPEVRRAEEEASHYFVNIVDLQKAVGKRLAEISGAESGMVTSGAAGSNAAALAACIAGSDPRKVWQLPDTTGLKHEVVMWGGRNLFDSAVRLAGGKLVVVNSLEQLRAAINDRTQGLMRSAVQWIVVGRQGPDQRGACQQQSCGRRGVPRDEGGERGDHRMPGRGGDMARGARASLPFRCSPTTILM